MYTSFISASTILNTFNEPCLFSDQLTIKLALYWQMWLFCLWLTLKISSRSMFLLKTLVKKECFFSKIGGILCVFLGVMMKNLFKKRIYWVSGFAYFSLSSFSLEDTLYSLTEQSAILARKGECS